MLKLMVSMCVCCLNLLKNYKLELMVSLCVCVLLELSDSLCTEDVTTCGVCSCQNVGLAAKL